MTIKVLFVCLGNICRSPMAEAVMGRLIDEAGLSGQIAVNSVGTSNWHVGEPPCSGTQRVLEQNGIAFNIRARQVTREDLADPATYVVAMDSQNLRDLRQRYGEHPRLSLLLDFATETKERNVPDPYYEGGFDRVYELISDGCRGLLDTIRQENLL